MTIPKTLSEQALEAAEKINSLLEDEETITRFLCGEEAEVELTAHEVESLISAGFLVLDDDEQEGEE